MAGSMCSSDGSGVGKNLSGGRDEMVMLYAMSSLPVQSLLDLAERMRFMATLKSDALMIIRCSQEREGTYISGPSFCIL